MLKNTKRGDSVHNSFRKIRQWLDTDLNIWPGVRHWKKLRGSLYRMLFIAMHALLKSLKLDPCLRDWSPKFATELNMLTGCSSKSKWVIKLSFCQNDFLVEESFWQNNSLVTHILFELQPIIIFSPVANFGDQSLDVQVNILSEALIFASINPQYDNRLFMELPCHIVG